MTGSSIGCTRPIPTKASRARCGQGRRGEPFDAVPSDAKFHSTGVAARGVAAVDLFRQSRCSAIASRHRRMSRRQHTPVHGTGRGTSTIPVIRRIGFGEDCSMAETPGEARFRQLRTPRSAAVAGIIFAVLFATAIVLLRTALPDRPSAQASGIRDTSRITAALVIAPFAGIAFLWFIGVLRDRLGALEDRFFSTVLLGSGLLFVAVTFVSTAVAGGVLAVDRDAGPARNDIVFFGREVVLHLNNVYGVRMAGVFMISLGTIWLRTALMPRWLVITTYLLALVLLTVVTFSLWVTLTFPIWVFVISAYILALDRRQSDHPG